ncbi:hypothetical protein [Pontivivens ytuae]|uniref:hypothetical protein n=1 Tax=Pontivivens ytuae TaxID=2789856 RepID=UPI001E65CD55|nr:hypothetical protein [Pontivivens ytuae]
MTKADPPHAFSYDFEPPYPEPNGLHHGTFSVRIEEVAQGLCEVTITERRKAQTLGNVVLGWLDDLPRDRMICARARIEGRRDWSMIGRQLPQR